MYDSPREMATHVPWRAARHRPRWVRTSKLVAMQRYRRVLGQAVLLASIAGCGGRSPGALTPPRDAPTWSAQFDAVFDDDFTGTAVELKGRAANDVRDQQLLAQRLGFSDLVVLGSIRQIYAKRRRGVSQAFALLEMEEILMGEVLPGTHREQVLPIAADDGLSAKLKDQRVLLFLRWAPGAVPPFHHHLMPAGPTVLAFVRALIEHAKEAGVLTRKGVIKKNRRGAALAEDEAIP